MTVAELIQKLEGISNQDADVYRINNATDYFSSDSEEFVTNIRVVEDGYIVIE